jgi:hypothetical protein
VSLPEPTDSYQAYGRELAELLELMLAGDLVTDRATAERLVRWLGALVRLQQLHCVDRHGRCLICRAIPRWWWPWPKHVSCTVHSALSFYLRQPERFVLSVITENAATVRSRS